jgi:hypothetical protein
LLVAGSGVATLEAQARQAEAPERRRPEVGWQLAPIGYEKYARCGKWTAHDEHDGPSTAIRHWPRVQTFFGSMRRQARERTFVARSIGQVLARGPSATAIRNLAKQVQTSPSGPKPR